MSEHTDKAKRTRLVAVIAAAAVLVIALGILVGGKLSGILFNGQDLFKTTPTPAVIGTPVAEAIISPVSLTISPEANLLRPSRLSILPKAVISSPLITGLKYLTVISAVTTGPPGSPIMLS